MLNVNLLTAQETREYHELINKTDRTKEENRKLETLKKLAQLNSIKVILTNLVNNNEIQTDNETKSIVNILEYENLPSMYRIQVLINNKYKTVARIKASKRDIHIAIRESTARELNKNYVIVNYNLPAQYHITYKEAYNHFNDIIKYHYEIQTA